MSNIKFWFLLFVAMYCWVERLMACSCRICGHYNNYYERCRCCTFHMVGGKRSGDLGATLNGNHALAALPLPKSLTGSDVQINGENPILAVSQTGRDLGSRVSPIEQERMKYLTMSLLTNPKLWLPETNALDKASTTSRDFVTGAGVPPSEFKIGKRRMVLPQYSVSRGNAVSDLKSGSNARHYVTENLLKPEMLSQLEEPGADNEDIQPLNHIYFYNVFNSLGGNKKATTTSILDSSEAEKEERTLKDLLTSTNA